MPWRELVVRSDRAGAINAFGSHHSFSTADDNTRHQSAGYESPPNGSIHGYTWLEQLQFCIQFSQLEPLFSQFKHEQLLIQHERMELTLGKRVEFIELFFQRSDTAVRELQKIAHSCPHPSPPPQAEEGIRRCQGGVEAMMR